MSIKFHLISKLFAHILFGICLSQKEKRLNEDGIIWKTLSVHGPIAKRVIIKIEILCKPGFLHISKKGTGLILQRKELLLGIAQSISMIEI